MSFMLHNGTKVIELVSGEQGGFSCANEKCERMIMYLNRYCMDLLMERRYCHQCGVCLRYARKKALERGETIESAEI